MSEKDPDPSRVVSRLCVCVFFSVNKKERKIIFYLSQEPDLHPSEDTHPDTAKVFVLTRINFYEHRDQTLKQNITGIKTHKTNLHRS